MIHPVHRHAALDTEGPRRPTGASPALARRAQAGLGLIEIMIAIGVAMAVVAGGLVLAKNARDSAQTARVERAVDLIRDEARRIHYARGHRSSINLDTFNGVSHVTLANSSRALGALPRESSGTGRFAVGDARISVSPSNFDAGTSTCTRNCSFGIEVIGLSRSGCMDLVRTYLPHVAVLRIEADGLHQVAVPTNPPSSLDPFMCREADDPTLTLHFN